jgi:hypothetical protein
VTMSGALVTAGLVATVALGVRLSGTSGSGRPPRSVCAVGEMTARFAPAAYGRRPTTDARYRVDTTPRRATAVVDHYEDAQAVVDRLADRGFPSSTW